MNYFTTFTTFLLTPCAGMVWLVIKQGDTEMSNGQKIKTIYGEILTVLSVTENMINTYEGKLVHVTKAWPVK